MSLKNGDLVGTIFPEVSVDEFEPKAGSEREVIVIAFYLSDREPADDLNTFIQRGVIDTLDVEVSPNTDEEGNYLLFVEMSRNDTFPEKFNALLRDIENLSGKMDWAINTYYSRDKTFSKNDPEMYSYLSLDPKTYVKKDKFKMTEIEEGIDQFFKGSLVTNLTLDKNIVTIKHNRNKIIAEVVDVGDYDTVIGRNFLAESAFDMNNNSYEIKILRNMLGNCHVIPIENYLFISRDDKVMLFKNTQLEYGN